ncbi:methyltransferase domain-containing protein [bacterium]|nr:methyltransferase domain-containing protein [bacterium]
MSLSRQDREQVHFDQLAESTGEIWWGSTTYAGKMRLHRRAQLIARFLGHSQGLKVLELGCGTGSLTGPLLDTAVGMELTACDISPATVERVKDRYGRRPGTSFFAADACHLGMPEASFDAVVGNSVLHHLPLAEALQEIRRVLKPGGKFWFSEPNMLNPQIAVEKNVPWIGRRLQNSPDETAFFRWSLASMLRAHGFVGVHIRPYDFLHPLIPKALVAWVHPVGLCLEQLPGLREIAGSLEIRGENP